MTYLKDCVCQQNKELYEAIFKTQDACKGMEADAQSSGPSKHAYLSLKGVYNAVKPPLKLNGLEVHHMQDIDTITGKQIQKTIIKHMGTGQVLEDKRYLVPDKPGCQGAGAAETYLKRYALLSMLGIATGENDDDGESGRIYMERCRQLEGFIKSRQNPELIIQAIKKKFSIAELKNLGDGGLFDAFLFALTFKG